MLEYLVGIYFIGLLRLYATRGQVTSLLAIEQVYNDFSRSVKPKPCSMLRPNILNLALGPCVSSESCP